MIRFASLSLALGLAACPAIGTGRALEEAERALIEAEPARLETAPARARFDWFTAESYLNEAHARAGHGDWAQAETWAVRARKAAEAALRRIVGDAP